MNDYVYFWQMHNIYIAQGSRNQIVGLPKLHLLRNSNVKFINLYLFMWFYNTDEDCKPDLVSVSTPFA